MDRARLQQLLDAYLDSRLTEEGRAALNAELATSPEACRQFWESVHQHALLAELVAEGRGMALAREEEPIASQPPAIKLFTPTEEPGAPAPGLPRTGRMLRRWLGLTAAVALLALGVSWLVQPVADRDEGDSGEPMARLGELQGDVQVVVAEAVRLARAGQRIRAGQEVRTGEGSSAVVTYDDSSRLELSSNTSVQLLDHASREEGGPAGKRIFLVKGVVHADVRPQPNGRPLVLSTQQADLVAPGTRFRSASILDETRIELEKGKAQLARKGESRTFEIYTGSYAVAASDGDVFNPTPLTPSRGEPYATLDEGTGPVMGLAVVNPRLLAVGCWNGIVKLWDLRTRQIRGQLDAGRTRTLALAATRDGRTLAVGYETKKKGETGLILWNLQKRRQLGDLAVVRRAHALAFTPDGRTLAVAGNNKGVLVWDPPDRRERIILGERTDRPVCLAISPDGRIVAAGGKDGKIRLWNLQTGRLDAILEGHRREVQALAFQSGGSLLASGSRDGTIRLWSLPTGDGVRVLAGNFREVRCLTFSPEGRTLASGHGGTVVLWNVLRGKQFSTVKAHSFAITAMVYLPDGRTLATAGWDRTVKLWDIRVEG